jgi:hypothetical protein
VYFDPAFCSFLLAQKMNQKRAKNPMLQRARLTRPSLDFWASPPKRSIYALSSILIFLGQSKTTI